MPITHYLILLGSIMLPLFSPAQQPAHASFERKYTTGDTYHYQLTTRDWQNGQFKGTTVAICELKVVLDSAGIPYDEVRWVAKKIVTPKDTLDESPEALAVKPYRISLHPKGQVAIPKIEQPGMTGCITDFNTFWVAISPGLEVGRLRHKGDSVMKAAPVRGDFSNGKTILKGEDYLAVKVRMTGETSNDVQLLTSFMPPREAGMQYLLPEMATPVVKDTLNNFQMVMAAGNDHVHVQYGRESFYINSTIRKSDGELLQADMYNILNLHLKVNCDSAWSHCQADMPFKIERRLVLELLD